jgi:lipoate-protein ligase A
MHFLDLTLPTPAENLALDEALLESAETDFAFPEVLRLWESPDVMLVLGRASRHAHEARLDQCARLGVSIQRRCSGGTAVVVGPGCLLYSVVLNQRRRPHLAGVEAIHQFVAQTLLNSLRDLAPVAMHEGSSDLTWQGRKFSGNALRIKRDHILYHGTLLYDFPLETIAACLPENPPRQPDYRAGRSHSSFVGILPVAAADLRMALREGWGAEAPLADWPRELTDKLARERYSQAEWIERM